MNPIEIINTSEWVFLESAQVHHDTDLELIFVIGSVSEKPENSIIGEAFPVNYNDQSERYSLTFLNFVGYSILNESYDNLDTTNEINIDGFRIYKKSNFLDYVLKDTFATQILKEEILHYFFLREIHLINVASAEVPEIVKLNTTKPKLH